MPSPFPGMNPYLEHRHVWEDFHDTMLQWIRAALIPQVLPDYYVRMNEYLYIRGPAGRARELAGRGDALVTHRTPLPEAVGGVAVVDAPPATARLPRVKTERRVYLEVRDRESEDVVTVLGLLSRSNKVSGDGRRQYHVKRQQLFKAGVHFVEVDLLRAGRRTDLIGRPPCDYYAWVGRPDEQPVVGIWPIMLRQTLPVIPVPLKGEAVVRLDLQNALHQAYDFGGFAHRVYSNPLDPPLPPADAEWAARFVPPADTPSAL